MAIIKTPDQRVRVFISSTINELADERRAARAAIENLRLIPVFFEAGARPHPPRDLYSAYLEQSHIFLGIYWNSYGWVAPGAEISGLEDEYRLCGSGKPKLIYVKKSEERQPRLNDLLADIEKSETACYQFFSNADELQTLIENDLSVLMSEIFENALAGTSHINQSAALSEIRHHRIVELPLIRSEILGRSLDTEKISEMLKQPGVSLITLLGAGGTGKTTLSIHIGHLVSENFSDGVAFVPLAPVNDYQLVPATIADVLNLKDSGMQPIEFTLLDFLTDKNLLLILDNFEQVIDASKFVSKMTARCANLKILITSRTSLHIRNERIYNLAPLRLPDEGQLVAPDELQKYPATQLFVERAIEVNPALQFTPENTAAIIEICQKMDGLPLAIELAAARTRFFQPAALMSRIDKTLDLVSRGHKDLPERQQTLRAAIEWSYNLLSPETQRVFSQLGVFRRSWTLEAADVILNMGFGGADVEEMTERLLDVSLIKPVLVSHSAEPRFNMLQTVHEYALEMLEKSQDATETKLRYAHYFYKLCKDSEWVLWGINSEAWLDKLEYEYQNIRASFHILIENKDYERVWEMLAYLNSYWIIRGGYSEALTWLDEAGVTKPELYDSFNVSKIVQGKTLTWCSLSLFMIFRIEEAYKLLNLAEDILKDSDDLLSYTIALVIDGCYGTYMNRADAIEKMNAGLALAEKLQHHFPLAMGYLWSYEHNRQQGRMDIVSENLNKAIEIVKRQGDTYTLATTYILKYSLALLNPEADYEQLKAEMTEFYNMLPEKGYKGMKAGALSGYCFCLLMLGELDKIEEPLFLSFHYSRESGEKEGELYGGLIAAQWLALKQQREKAVKVFSAVDAFIRDFQYPLLGSAEAQYNYSKAEVFKAKANAEFDKWYSEGQRMSLSEALMLAAGKD